MLAVLALAGLGIAGIYAATAGRANPDPDVANFALKQAAWVFLGLVVFAVALVPSYTRLAHYSYVLYGASILVLAGLALFRHQEWEIPGLLYPINQAYSWIKIPGTGQSIQPSELTKLAFIMALAYYLRYRKNYRTFPGLLVPFAMALVPTALVLYQPDLGTGMLFLPILFLMLFAAGARGKHLLAIIAMGLAMVPVFYSSMHGYQRIRIDSWLLQGCAERMHFAIREARADAVDDDPPLPASIAAPKPDLPDQEKAALARDITSMWRFRLWRLATAVSWGRDKPEFADARRRLFETLDRGPGPEAYTALRRFFASILADYGHQAFQATIAVGAGGRTGCGWLQGSQTRHGLLPEAHTDFLFPTLAEQFGFVGAAAVVVLYGLLCVLGIDVSFSTEEPFGKLLVVGVVAQFAAQSFLNLAMSVGLVPVTGIPLPLMSYGGSSMLSSFLALALLCNVALRRLYLIAPRPFEWRE